MNVGFIGTGSMGTILIEAMIASDALQPDQIVISNRTMSKAEKLAEQYPGLCATPTNREVVQECEIIFICVKPAEFVHVLDDIRSVVLPSHILVSITSPVMIHHLEQQLQCKIAKVVPSITNYVCSGATLCMFGSRMTESDRELVYRLLKPMSTPLLVSEDYTRIASDLSSCGPAFLCFFVQQFIDAAVSKTGIPAMEATRLASEMVLGTGKLITSGKFDPTSLMERVSVPGGITAKGLQLLAQETEGMFTQLIRTTHAKYEEDVEKLDQLFSSLQY